MQLTFQDFKQIFYRIAERIEQDKDYFSELDRALGDGDHGVTMSIGWQAVVEKLNDYQGEDISGMLKEIAMSFLNAVGSSVGPLYATAFLRGSAALQGKTELREDDVVLFLKSAIEGIQERGKAQIGDKTMMDTWLPALQSLQQSREEGKSLVESLDAAVAAGQEGMNATAQMLSQIGRSSRLGERSVGHLDPGAASALAILRTLTDEIKKLA